MTLAETLYRVRCKHVGVKATWTFEPMAVKRMFMAMSRSAKIFVAREKKIALGKDKK